MSIVGGLGLFSVPSYSVFGGMTEDRGPRSLVSPDGIASGE